MAYNSPLLPLTALCKKRQEELTSFGVLEDEDSSQELQEGISQELQDMLQRRRWILAWLRRPLMPLNWCSGIWASSSESSKNGGFNSGGLTEIIELQKLARTSMQDGCIEKQGRNKVERKNMIHGTENDKEVCAGILIEVRLEEMHLNFYNAAGHQTCMTDVIIMKSRKRKPSDYFHGEESVNMFFASRATQESTDTVFFEFSDSGLGGRHGIYFLYPWRHSHLGLGVRARGMGRGGRHGGKKAGRGRHQCGGGGGGAGRGGRGNGGGGGGRRGGRGGGNPPDRDNDPSLCQRCRKLLATWGCQCRTFKMCRECKVLEGIGVCPQCQTPPTVFLFAINWIRRH